MIALARTRIAILFGVLGVCAGCGAEPDTRAHGEATLRPALVAQRVNAVVRRQARQLVYLEIERQSFVTTPEHPFATVDSGWVRAGQLAPGDRVISAKFGSLRVSSVRVDTRAQAVPVFNLRVERAHAYWVGSADVLVHNTGCGALEDTLAQKTREVEEIRRQLDELKNGETSSSSEQPLDRKNKIEALKAELRRAQRRLNFAKSKTKPWNEKATTQPREDNITRKSREIEQAQRELEALKNGEASSSSEQPLDRKNKIEALEAELKTAKKRLAVAKSAAKAKGGTQPREDNITRKSREIEQAQRELEALQKTVPTSSAHALQLLAEIAEQKSKLAKLNDALRSARHRQKRKTPPELINEGGREILRGDALKAALAAAQAELHELQRKRADSQDPTAAPEPREAELEKRIREHTFDLEKEAELRELENRLAELEKVVPTPDAPHLGLEPEKKELKKLIKNKKLARKNRRAVRRRREDPDYVTRMREYSRMIARRARRSERYVNDPTREPDTIDRLEQEVAELTEAPSSPTRDGRLNYSKYRLEKLKRLAALRVDKDRVRRAIRTARNRKQTLTERGQDTTSIDEKLAAYEQRLKELVQQFAMEQAREILDGFDDGSRAASSIDPASPIDQEFLDQLLAEIANEQAAREEQLQQDTVEVDEELRLINEFLADILSSPPGEVSEAVARLSRELQDERAQFNYSHFALVNESAFLSSTLGHDNPAAVLRMAEVRVKMEALRLAWQQNTQKRLDETRKLLRGIEGNPRFRDETLEAELAEQIALLEDELAHPPF